MCRTAQNTFQRYKQRWEKKKRGYMLGITMEHLFQKYEHRDRKEMVKLTKQLWDTYFKIRTLRERKERDVFTE